MSSRPSERRPRDPTLSAGVGAPPGPSYTAPKSRDNRPRPLPPIAKERLLHAHAPRKARNVPQAPRARMLRHPHPLGRGLAALSPPPRPQAPPPPPLALPFP